MANRVSKADNIFRTTLTGAVSTTTLNFPFASVTGLELPQYLVIDPQVPARTEIVYFDGAISDLDVSTTLLANRDQEGSVGAVEHDSGAEVWASPVGQHIEDLHDRVSQHTHDGTAEGGAVLGDFLLLDGSRPMTGDLDMGGNDILNAADLTASGTVTAENVVVNGVPQGLAINNIDFERINFPMPTGTGMRLARDLLGISAFPGWERGHIVIQVHLHLENFVNSWRLDTLLDGTGVNAPAGVGGVFLWANDDFWDGGSSGGSGHGQLFSNAASGTEVQGFVTYYQYRLE